MRFIHSNKSTLAPNMPFARGHISIFIQYTIHIHRQILSHIIHIYISKYCYIITQNYI